MLQSAKLALHAPIAQTPAVQVAAALGKRQRLPQAPQLSGLLATSVSQPVFTLRSHSAKPGRHAVGVQRALTQTEKLPVVAPSQEFSQDPQLALSLSVSTHSLPQRVSPTGQRQTPPPDGAHT